MSAEYRLEIALAIPLRDRAVLVARRRDDAHQGGLFEFPGGKIEPGEAPRVAALRELREEVGLEGGELEPMAVFVHDYPDRRLRFHPFLVRGSKGEPSPRGRAWAWVAVEDLDRVPMPPANRALVRVLASRFGILSEHERADDRLPGG